MGVDIINVDENNIDFGKIKKAAKALRNGGLVAFPTETVYGLGANALDSHAVEKIFKAKGRPQDNPLIAHVSNKNDVKALVKEIPENAHALMDAFWPGPLTIVLEKTDVVPDKLTAGLGSVAIRMPANKIALALIEESGVPIAAPSANISGSPSPTTASHVIQDFSDKIDVIIDGGKTKIGVESTVVDLTLNPPAILRPGKITKEDLEEVVGTVTYGSKNNTVKSPGMKYRHYAPKAKLIIAEDKIQTRKLVDEHVKKHLKVGVMTTKKQAYKADVVRHLGDSLEEIANNLYATLREFDQDGVDVIIAQTVKDKGLGQAIMNRIKKASDGQN